MSLLPVYSQSLPANIRYNLNPRCVGNVQVRNGKLKEGDPYPYNLRQVSPSELLSDGITCTVFRSFSESFSAKIHPLTILETPVFGDAKISTFFSELHKAAYLVGGANDGYISANQHFSHKVYRTFASSHPNVEAVFISKIKENLRAHRGELISIARGYGYTQEQAAELCESIIVQINPNTSKIICYAAPEEPFNEFVAGRGSHKDDSNWHSSFGRMDKRTSKIVRR